MKSEWSCGSEQQTVHHSPLTVDGVSVSPCLREAPYRAASFLVSDDLDQYTLAPAPVEFPVKDLLPGAEVQLAPGDGHHHFASHHLALDMSVGVIFAGIVVPVL